VRRGLAETASATDVFCHVAQPTLGATTPRYTIPSAAARRGWGVGGGGRNIMLTLSCGKRIKPFIRNWFPIEVRT
jgi:hypothetical protein